MKKKEQYKNLILFMAAIILVTCLTVIFSIVWYRFYAYSGIIGVSYYRRGNWVVVALYAMMSYMFNKLFGNFRVGYVRRFESLYLQIMSVLSVNFVTYLLLCLIGRWAFTQHVGPILYMTAVDCILVMIWVYVTRHIYVKIYPPRELLLVYGQYSPDRLIEKLATRDDKYNVKETISIDVDIEVIKNKINDFEGVILADIPSPIRNKLVKECFSKNIRCYSIPKISDIMIMSAETIHLFDTSLLLFRNTELSLYQQFCKRALDIVVSFLALVILSPVFAVITLCVKMYDHGPAFFTQERLTKDGKVFQIIKFRSMKVNDSKEDVSMTKKDDDRITPIGKRLRNLHLDELPQLINILKGEMSLVGPRPECPSIAKEYSTFLPEFDYRLKVKAGLTGYAQVYGQYNTTPYDKLKLDLNYIENYSFMLDIKLLILTAKIVFWKEKSEGVEAWQTTAATQENLNRVEKNEK